MVTEMQSIKQALMVPLSALSLLRMGTTLLASPGMLSDDLVLPISASKHSSSELLDELVDSSHSPHRTVSICGQSPVLLRLETRWNAKNIIS